MEILANLQLILFSMPIVSFTVLGVFILLKPVAVINRRWYLAVVIPLLLANLLALIETNLGNNYSLAADWQFWLVVVVDIAMLIGSILVFRGFLIFGLTGSEIMEIMKQNFEAKQIVSRLHAGEKKSILGTPSRAIILTIEDQDTEREIWITESLGEVILRADSKNGFGLAREAMPELRRLKKPFIFKQHTMGILYIVLAVVLAVFGWIFFFEPRLILVD